MTRHIPSRFALAFCAVALTAATAHAQSTVRDAVLAARPALVHFDPDSPAPLEAIAELGRSLEGAPDGIRTREARFVRAVASADYLLIARHRRSRAMRARLARAHGSEPEQLERALHDELSSLAFGVYAPTVRDVLEALEPPEELSLPPLEADHTRRQAAFFSRIAERLSGAEAPEQILAELVADPCAGARTACPPPYRSYGPRGRRIVAGMSGVLGVASALERAGRRGDPFAAAVAREVLVDQVVLRSIRIAPRDWAPMVQAVDLPEGHAVEADALVVIGGSVRAGWAPRIGWDRAGRPIATVSGGRPLADARSDDFALPSDLSPFVRPIDGLAAYLRRRVGGARRIGVALEPGVQAHLLSRVLRSMEEAGLDATALVGVGSDGVPRGVAIRARHDDPDDRRHLGVFVRVGGISVTRPHARSTSLPRVRRGDEWRYDLGRLARLADDPRRPPVLLRFMGTAAADRVLAAGLVAGGPDRTLELLTP